MSDQTQQAAPTEAADIDNHFLDMAEKYLGWAKADVGRMDDFIRGLRENMADADSIDQVFKVVHGIKGQGSTFGYELMTEVGQVLSEYLKKRPDPLTTDQLNVIEQHVRAMKLILERKITGAGGEVGEKLVRRLRSLAAPANVG